MITRIVLIFVLCCCAVIARDSSSTFSTQTIKSTYSVTSVYVDPADAELDSNLDLETIVSSIQERNLRACEDSIPSDIFKGRHVVLYPEYAISSIAAQNNRTVAVGFAQEATQLDTIPCYNLGLSISQNVTRRFSCLARRREVYVVVGMVEREPCFSTQSCRSDGFKLHASTLVFDPKGRLIARYRRGHLYGESALDVPATISPVSFNTSFGVRFGVLNGFDLMFEQPATALLEDGVTEFVVPYALQGMLPFLTPLQLLSGWQRSISRVNILAACYDSSSQGHAGCGRFYADGSSAYSTSEGDCGGISTCTISLTGNVTSAHGRSTVMAKSTLLPSYAQYNLTNFTITDLIVSTHLKSKQVCNNGFCCTITYQLTHEVENANYKILVFSGDLYPDSEDSLGWKGVQICGVVACRGKDCAPMETPEYVAGSQFKELKIRGTFKVGHVMPSTRKIYEPIERVGFDREQSNEGYTFTLELPRGKNNDTIPVGNISVFALHSLDLPERGNGGGGNGDGGNGSSVLASSLLLVIVAKSSLLLIIYKF